MKRGLTSLEHYRVGPVHESTIHFGVQMIPHFVIINKQGHIVFIGHPSLRINLEDDIDKLLNDETLKGPLIHKPSMKPITGTN